MFDSVLLAKERRQRHDDTGQSGLHLHVRLAYHLAHYRQERLHDDRLTRLRRRQRRCKDLQLARCRCTYFAFSVLEENLAVK